MTNSFLKLSLLAGTAIASAAHAATPQILFSSNPSLAAGTPVQGEMTVDGSTQIRTADGATVAFVGPARINVGTDGTMTLLDGHATVVSGNAKTEIRTAGGAVTVDRGSAMLQVARGIPSGRLIDGSMVVQAGSISRRFNQGAAFTVNGSGNVVQAVTAGAQPVSTTPRPGTLIDQPQSAEQVLHNAVLLSGAPGSANAVIADQSNPAFPTLPTVSVATLLEQAVALRDAAGGFRFTEASDALLQVQLAFLKSGGAAGAFTDASAANVLSAYLDYLAKGGNPAQYGATSSTLVAAYISYLQTVGLPQGIPATDRTLLQNYFEVVAAGGAAFDQATVVAALDAYVSYLATGGSPSGYTAISAALLKAYTDYLATIGGGSALAGDVATRIAAYQALVAAGAGNFGASDAAALLTSYLTYLKSGGSANGFTTSEALLRAYYNYLVAFGLPEGLDAATRQTITDYIAYLKDGGSFGTVPTPPPPVVDPDPTPTPDPDPVPTGNGIGVSSTVSASIAASGLYFGGPGDPGVIHVAVDAQGRPASLDYFGAPGTATLKEFESGNGYVIGRFGGGTFGTNLSYADNDGVHFAMLAPTTALPTSGSALYTVAAATNPTLPGSSSIFARAKFEMTLGVSFGTTPSFGYEGALTGTVDGGTVHFTFASAGGSAAPSLTNTYISDGALSLYGGTTTLTGATGAYCGGGSGCNFAFNGISGGTGASGFGIGYTIVDGTTNHSIINGAAVLTQGGASVTSSAPSPSPAGTVPSAGSMALAIGKFGMAPNSTNLSYDGLGELSTAAYTLTGQGVERGTAAVIEGATVDGVIGWARWGNGTAKVFGADNVLSGDQSEHVVWGTAATNLPTSGTVTYALAGATKPTVVDGSVAPGDFTGQLAVDFATAKVGLDSMISIGGATYRFASTGGVVTPSMTLNPVADSIYAAMSFHGATDATLGQFGSVNGFLAGPGGGYAGLDYQTNITGVGTVTGAAVFKGN